MSGFLIDTNVFLNIFKGDLELSRFIKESQSFIDTTIYVECIQGSKSNREKQIIEKYLQSFPLLPITPVSSSLTIKLIRKYSNSHGLLLPDALIAATALENDLAIITFDIDDFKFIEGLNHLRPSN